MRIRKLLNGLTALLITAGILLLADLGNRISPSDTERPSAIVNSNNIYAVKGKIYRMGMTYFGPDKTFEAAMEGLWKGLKDLGFVKDSNLIVLSMHANGEMANLQPIHLSMDNQKVDMILVTSTPGITAAISAVKKHPMVFSMAYTPLEAGAGKSYTDHLPNITGVGSFPPVEKTFDFIQEILPRVKRIGTIYNSSEANSVKVIQVGRDYAKKKGLELVETSVINSSEVYQAISALCMRDVDVVWVTGDNTALQAISSIIKVCRDHKIPLILNDVDYVKEGALAAVGIGWYSTGVHTASFVARVLNGESPAKIPIENFVEESITINQEVAASLGVVFPKKYLGVISAKPKKKHYKFCLAHYVDSPNSENIEEGIREELKRQGLTEGKDFSMKVYNAQGDISTLNSIAEAISSEKWDLVFASSTPTTQAFARKITNSPIVFSNVGDPVRAGLGTSYTEHNPNITGISTMSDFDGLIRMLTQTMPGIKVIGTVFTPGEVNSVAYTDELRKAAAKKGIELISVPANNATEVSDAAGSLVSRGIQAFTQISDNLTCSAYASIIKAAYNNQIPYFAFVTEQVKDGAVAALARDYTVAGSDAAKLGLKILNGVSPRDIPFQLVSKTTITVNPEAESFFNVKIPARYLK